MKNKVNRISKREKESEDARLATLYLLEDLEEERTQLALAKAMDEALLESIGDGLISTDREGRVVNMNGAAERLLKSAKNNFLGKILAEDMPLYDDKNVLVPANERPSKRALNTGKAVTAVYFYERKDGTRFPAATIVTPVILKKKTVGAIMIFRDVTKELELDKEQNEFISLASHQLKNPITGIAWSMELILDGKEGPIGKRMKDALRAMHDNIKNMFDLVTGFLDVTKIESGAYSLEKGEVDLIMIADSVLEELKGQISEKGIKVVKKYGQNVPLSNIGIKTARVIFQNLITNAVKYTPVKGTVEVKIEKSAKGVTISIMDTGYGIPEDAKEKIFTKLFRADNIKKTEPSGTGLGLYLVKSLVEKLGGKIWFESEEGKGSTFSVQI